MPLYRYAVFDASGSPHQGYLVARNEEEATRALSSQGYKLVALERIREIGTPRNQEVNARNLGVVCKQLASLLRAGVSLVEALNIVSQQTAPPLGDLLEEVYSDVASGQYGLAAALQKHPKIPRYLVGMIRAAEDSGRVRETLEQIHKNLSKAVYFRSLVISALTYPGVILATAILIVLGMVYFLVPSMLSSLTNLQEEGGEVSALPLPTMILISFTNLLRNPFFLLGTGAGLLFVAKTLLDQWRAGGEARGNMEAFILRVPILGELYAKSQMITTARLLGAMLQSNLPLPRALQLLEGTITSLLYRRAVAQIREQVEEGVNLSLAFRENPHLFSALFRSLLETGERNADLPNMLEEVARIYEEEYESRLKTLSTLLEPIMLISVGILIGGIMLAILLPYFSVLSSLGGGQ